MIQTHARSKFAPFLALPLLAFVACNAPENAGASDGTPVALAPGQPDGNGGFTGATPATPAVGESCVDGDADKICLAIRFVTYTNNGAPAASATQAATIIHKMNSLFSQCNIGFQIQTYEQVNPADYGLAYGSASQSQTDSIRGQFEVDDRLLAVTTGPWGTAVNAWTNMPGDNVYGAIMEQSIVAYGDGIIYAHEFGHYLGLDHVSDTSNLMSAIIYTSSSTLTSGQCSTARSVANSYWSRMIRG
jgi:hypothetical protein